MVPLVDARAVRVRDSRRASAEPAGDRVRALRASPLTAPEPHGESRRLAARARPAPVHIRRSDGALPRGAALNERSEVVSNTDRLVSRALWTRPAAQRSVSRTDACPTCCTDPTIWYG